MTYSEAKDEEYKKMLREYKRLLITCNEWEKLQTAFVNKYNILRNVDNALVDNYEKLLYERTEMVSECLEIIGLQKCKIEQLSEIIKSLAPSPDEIDKSSNNYVE